jgi:hypothetical protein
VELPRYTSSISFLRLLSRGLQPLRNLRDLFLNAQGAFQGKPLSGSWHLDRCAFKLRSLGILFSVSDHSFLSFLQRQDELRHLELWAKGPIEFDVTMDGVFRPTNGPLIPETYWRSPSFLPNITSLAAYEYDAFRVALSPISNCVLARRGPVIGDAD